MNNFFYELNKYDHPYFKFVFNDNRWINIDLVNDYPHYKLVENNIWNNIWKFTIIKHTDDNYIGTIKDFNYKDIRHFNANPNIISFNNITYKKTNQTEYDKYMFQINPNNDNSRLYKYLYDILEEEKDNRFVEITLV